MAKHTHDPTLSAAQAAVQSAHSVCALHASSFQQLGALFSAIIRMAPEHHVVRHIGEAGHNLASDWANMHENERNELEAHVDRLSGLLGATAGATMPEGILNTARQLGALQPN
jgi:hypothetical protein